jgi:glutaredoxin
MTVKLYKSALCPRCAYAHHQLKALQDEGHDFELITYDILTDMKAFKEANILMIPTIVVNDTHESWFFPKREAIRTFVLSHLQ